LWKFSGRDANGEDSGVPQGVLKRWMVRRREQKISITGLELSVCANRRRWGSTGTNVGIGEAGVPLQEVP